MDTTQHNKKITNKINDSLSSDIMVNLERLQKKVTSNPDLVVRSFQTKEQEHVSLFYYSSLVDKISVNEHLLRPLMFELESTNDLLDPNLSIPIGKVTKVFTWDEIERATYEGHSILFIDHATHALSFCTQGWPQRAIQEPQIESSVK